MKYIKFTIKNFKGIKEIELDLTQQPTGKIFPLVGLNESGKTTILEAINLLQEDVKSGTEYKMIHKKDAGSFTGNIEIEAKLTVEKKDNDMIVNFLKEKSLEIEKELKTMSIKKIYVFENASYKATRYNRPLSLKVKTHRQRQYKDLKKEDEKLWDSLVEEIKKNVPKILYFPDFLFDFPSEIYLENIPNLPLGEKEQTIQEQYRNIIDDVLRSTKYHYSLNDFLAKIKSTAAEDVSSRNQIKSEIESKLNEKILTPWNEIFHGAKKTIQINLDNDNNAHFLEIKIKEGENLFLVNERSLGFRWFFGFILFTEFRKSRVEEEGEYLFLFDEPASNLHESSQQKLLELFEKLTDKSKIIYSTHSPYLINPKFILNCFIVKDVGRENEDSVTFRQDIKATPYREFVAHHPNEETHFKPILDVLDFKATDFDLTDKIVFFEGKFDYYTFSWIKKNFFSQDEVDFKFYPGAGVNKYENIFREYLAHNKKFIAVFDSDGAGKKASKIYIKNIFQELEKYIFTLEDIETDFNSCTTEGLFTEEEKINIQKKSFPDSTTYKKREFNTAIQELFIQNKCFDLSNKTKDNFKKIFAFINDKFNQLENS